MHPRVLVVVLCTMLTGMAVPARAVGTVARGWETERTTSPLAPGLVLTEFERFGPRGWVRGNVLSADLSQPALQPEYLHPPVVAEREPLSRQVARQHAVAGVNGDFFDIKATGAPLGVGVDRGQLLNAPARGHNETAVIGGGTARLVRLFLAAALTREDGSRIPVSDLNEPEVAPGGIALYTPAWGAASRKSAVAAGEPVVEVEVVDGVVRRVSDAPAEGAAAGNAVRLLGTGAGAQALRALRLGERVDVRFRPKVADPPRAAISGDQVLLRDGVVQPVDARKLEPRTAVGFSASGERMWLVTVDGRQPGSRGMSKRELGALLKSFGASTALNLDGGGSSTLLARSPGEPAAELRNHPSSHGEERPVPNGLGFSTEPGSGRLRGIRVRPEGTAPGADRVFSGLTRRMRAFGHDEVGSPVPFQPLWTVEGSGRVQGGVLQAGEPGASQVSAESGAVHGRAHLRVLGPLAHLDSGGVRLPGRGAAGTLRVSGQDGQGFRTWVEPSDVRLSYDPRIVRVRPAEDHFEVTALSDGPAVVTAEVGDRTVHLPVSVGPRNPVVPADPLPRDSSVVTDGTLPPRAGANRVAVLSGAGVDPGKSRGARLARARRALRDARRAHPDVVVVDGNFVARGTSGDVALARRLIRSELGGVRWLYAPGRGEANNPRGLRAFRAAFGSPHRVVDVRGTRFVLLDASRPTLRGSDFDQFRMLRESLRTAAAKPAVKSVAVFVGARSADPEETALLDRWFADFEQRTGKPVVEVEGDAGGPRAAKVDGVQHESNGNVTGSAAGGFTGTSLLSINSRGAPIRWETRPFVDRLQLNVPARVRVGQGRPAGAVLGQDGRVVPVTYPVSADWSGSPGVHIGDPAGAKPWQVAAFDPGAGRLVGLRPGSGELRVAVNGVRRSIRFSVGS